MRPNRLTAVLARVQRIDSRRGARAGRGFVRGECFDAFEHRCLLASALMPSDGLLRILLETSNDAVALSNPSTTYSLRPGCSGAPGRSGHA